MFEGEQWFGRCQNIDIVQTDNIGSLKGRLEEWINFFISAKFADGQRTIFEWLKSNTGNISHLKYSQIF